MAMNENEMHFIQTVLEVVCVMFGAINEMRSFTEDEIAAVKPVIKIAADFVGNGVLAIPGEAERRVDELNATLPIVGRPVEQVTDEAKIIGALIDQLAPILNKHTQAQCRIVLTNLMAHAMVDYYRRVGGVTSDQAQDKFVEYIVPMVLRIMDLNWKRQEQMEKENVKH